MRPEIINHHPEFSYEKHWYGYIRTYNGAYDYNYNILYEDTDDQPNKTSTPLYGKDPSKVFGNKKKKGRF